MEPKAGTINSVTNTELVDGKASIIVNATSNFETATLFLLNKDTNKFSKFTLKIAENKDVKWNNQLPGNYQVTLKDGKTIIDSKELTF